MKKIKKWQVSLFIILGISAFWFSQNMWAFEKEITKEEFSQKIIGNWFNGNNNYTFWEEDSSFTSNGIQNISTFEERELYWELKDDLLKIYGFWIPDSFTKPCTEYDKDICIIDKTRATSFESKMKIIRMSNNYLIIEYLEGHNLDNKPKRKIFQKRHRNV